VDIIQILVEQSPLGIILAAMIANIFPGIPEEVFLLGLGYYSATTGSGFLVLGSFLIVGLMISDTILYYASYRGLPWLKNIFNKLWGKDLDQNQDFLKKHQYKIIFFSRFVMNLRAIGPFTAGLLKMPYLKFFMINALALIIYVPLMLSIGYYFQDRIELILGGVGVVKNAIFMGVVLILIFVIIRSLKRRFKKKYKNGAAGVEQAKKFFGFSKIEDDD
jgi:membrane-associated protein